ncbi:MAG: flagellar biosynthesis anti-sigma factor FlgM [Dehalococcoidia bacterium]
MEINRASSGSDPRRIPDQHVALPPSGDGRAAPARQERSDRIEVSDEARRLRGQQSEQERAAFVAGVRERLDSGAYRVDADGVARRIAEREHLA